MIKLTTYKDLYSYIAAFGRKKLNLLVVISRGGLGKSFISEDALIEQGPLIFTGHVTPLRLYTELLQRNEEERDFITIFDDVDSLMLNKTNVALLKQICDTREDKTIKYFTTSPILKNMKSEFETSCKVLMLMNDIETDDKNLNALLTRAHIIDFVPSDLEILKYMRTFGQDKEVLDFIKTYAPFSKTLNLRIYKRAEELKSVDLNWKQEVINELNVDKRLFEVQTLMNTYKTDKEREEHFSESRANYYRFKKLFSAKVRI